MKIMERKEEDMSKAKSIKAKLLKGEYNPLTKDPFAQPAGNQVRKGFTQDTILGKRQDASKAKLTYFPNALI